jgi:hypothetical protein
MSVSIVNARQSLQCFTDTRKVYTWIACAVYTLFPHDRIMVNGDSGSTLTTHPSV